MDELRFDESGELDTPLLERPCAVSALNGSWLLEISSALPTPARNLVRGPLRIEVGESSLRASGDIYVRRLPFPWPAEDADLPQLTFPRPVTWYPQLPPEQYSWYFRSTGATYAGGTLTLPFVRHLWDTNRQQFVSTDTGTLTLRCMRPLFTLPFAQQVMTGTMRIGGGLKLPVKATKTSSSYRSCQIEVDVMTGRNWPANAVSCNGVAATFEDVYRTAGWDVRVALNELNVPDDALLTTAELQTLLATHRQAAANLTDWRVWMLVGSANDRGSYGVMFDQDDIPREGVVGFADARLQDLDVIHPNARGQALDDVPFAFLRTLTHEAGHALNLFHPKDDVHLPPIGRTIMNQTGDVIGFATVTDPYPCNAMLSFDDHNRKSLIHSPDPQVRPGWRAFGWGHGSASSGVPEPADELGFAGGAESPDLVLTLTMPTDVAQGEYVMAEITVTNVGGTARDVSAAVNLAEGDLRLVRVRPSQVVDEIRDVVLACGPRRTVRLEPAQSVTGRAQLLFTSVGYTFDEVGSHDIRAEYDPGEDGRIVRSAPVRVHVRPPVTDAERAFAGLTSDPGAGRAVALGDFGLDQDSGDALAGVARQFPETDTGAAYALVMANSLARTHTNFRTEDTRDASPDGAQEFLDLAAQNRSGAELMALATTVASPLEPNAPVVGMALERTAADREAAVIAADFIEPEAR